MMSLRSKIALVLLVAVAGFTGVDHFLYRQNFETRFEGMDHEAATAVASEVQADVERVLGGLEQTGGRIVRNLAFEVEQGTGVDSTWIRQVALALDDSIEVMAVVDGTGAVRTRRVLDPSTGEPSELRELPNEHLNEFHPLRRQGDGGHGLRGIWMTSRGALLVVSVEGWDIGGDVQQLILGRFLDDALLDEIGTRAGVPVQALLVGLSELSDSEYELLYGAAWPTEQITRSLSEGSMRAWARLDDISGSPAVLLRMDVSVQHSLLWAELQQYDVASTLAVVLLFPLVILQLLQWIVTGPLAKLTSHATWVSRADDPSLRLGLERSDEIGVLASEFDTMLGKLADSRAEVMRTARLAGMSEVSVGVMHNVGNVLTSLSTSASMTRQHLQDICVQDDLRAVREALEANIGHLDEYLGADARGSHLMNFLGAIIEEIDQKTNLAAGEMGELNEGVAHMEALLCSLSKETKAVDVAEVVDVCRLVDSVIELALTNSGRATIPISRLYADIPNMMVDRHKLTEVLVHVVQNAIQAMDDLPEEDQLLRVTIEVCDGSLLVELTDNGIGIDPQLLDQIFTMGYTTRGDARGFGLHFAATSTTELGGHLAAQSHGLGQGASLQIRLPLRLPAGGGAAAAA